MNTRNRSEWLAHIVSFVLLRLENNDVFGVCLKKSRCGQIAGAETLHSLCARIVLKQLI